MGKPAICTGENKGADQLHGNTITAKLIGAFVFATRIVQFLFYLNPKFQASNCIGWFVSDMFKNHIVCFLMRRLILWLEKIFLGCFIGCLSDMC